MSDGGTMSAMHREQLEQMRLAARRLLATLVPGFDGAPIHEAILLRDSRMTGHQLSCNGWKVCWFIGQDQLWIHEPGKRPRGVPLHRELGDATASKAA
jgi:hypothetical protein